MLRGASYKTLGSGIGLSQAKQYMEQLNGKLSLETKLKKGTTIILTFPVV
ncbi:MAG: ATP-binding protein [Gammaproteobacteria bacterium]|nr:ATP-binding protein [Gammaproteobacteria bacterium]